MRIIDVYVSDADQAIKFLNKNTEVFSRKIRKLERKNRSNVLAGIIFGIVVELCFMEQSQRIAELSEKLGRLNMEIKELRDGKGD